MSNALRKKTNKRKLALPDNKMLYRPSIIKYAEYSMRNARFDEARTGIKIAEKNVNNVRYTDDTTLMDPDNHDGVITHLETDILEFEVKWALEGITTNKVSGGDGIPV